MKPRTPRVKQDRGTEHSLHVLKQLCLIGLEDFQVLVETEMRLKTRQRVGGHSRRFCSPEVSGDTIGLLMLERPQDSFARVHACRGLMRGTLDGLSSLQSWSASIPCPVARTAPGSHALFPQLPDLPVPPIAWATAGVSDCHNEPSILGFPPIDDLKRIPLEEEVPVSIVTQGIPLRV